MAILERTARGAREANPLLRVTLADPSRLADLIGEGAIAGRATECRRAERRSRRQFAPRPRDGRLAVWLGPGERLIGGGENEPTPTQSQGSLKRP
jgi:hypothetical protein